MIPCVLLLTPNRLLGDSLAACLQQRRAVAGVVVVAGFDGLRAYLADGVADLVLVDVTHGIDRDEVRAVAALPDAPPLLALGLDLGEQGLVACGRAGFANFVARSVSIEDLCAAMADTVAGRLRCSPEDAGELLIALYRDAASASKATLCHLTHREQQVLGLLRDGLSNKEIGVALGLSLATIKHHISNIFPKLHVTRRAEAMQKVRDTPWLVGAGVASAPRYAFSR